MAKSKSKQQPLDKIDKSESRKARLFPVLADTSKENRMASIFLAVLPVLPELAKVLFLTLNQRIGKRAEITTLREVTFKSELERGRKVEKINRPDGYVLLDSGRNVWDAVIEAKIGKNPIKADQVERYIKLARENNVNAVITISNEFVAYPTQSPVKISGKQLQSVDLFHWSWTFIRTQCEMLRDQGELESSEQLYILDQFIELLNDSGTGIERFNEMPEAWTEVVAKCAGNEPLRKSDETTQIVASAWISELRDASLLLSSEVAEPVTVKVEKALREDPEKRLKDIVTKLCDEQLLTGTFKVPDAAADIDVKIYVAGKHASVSMMLKAPQDKVRTSSRVNWLLRMLKETEDDELISIRAHWPGRKSATDAPIADLRVNPDLIDEAPSSAVPHSFEVVMAKHLSRQFGRRKIISEFEDLLLKFYNTVGYHLRAWQPPPPKPVRKRTANDKQESEAEDAFGSDGESEKG